MRTMKLWIPAVLMIVLASLAAAQQEKAAEPAAPTATYRVQYTVSEVADGKRVNSRSYETLVQEPAGGSVDWTQIRLGNRVPVPGEKGLHYLDVGISIDCGLQRVGGQLVMKTRFDLSSLAPEQGGAQGAMPVLRSIRFTADELVNPGQKTLLSSGEDVNSNHRFEVEALLTRVK